jgi:hypothetical protein
VLNNFASGQLAWARLDDRHERFTIVGDFFLPNDLKTTESAVERLPDGSWCAVSRQEEGPRPRRPDLARPLPAPPAQDSQLGRPGSRADGDAAGS